MENLKPATSYEELLTEIDRLRVSKRGVPLVFRGDTKDRGGLAIPSILRPQTSSSTDGENIEWRRFVFWHTMSEAIEYEKFRTNKAAGQKKDESKPTQQIPSLHTYHDALLQHYGARSTFVDVSKSLDVALWFAHHQLVINKLIIGGKRARGAEHNRNTKVEITAARYIRRERNATAKGYLFVFPMQRPATDKPIRHGDFVDLTPWQLSSRMIVQEAGLLYADRSVDGGQLKPLAVYEFAVPLRGTPRALLRRKASELFPSPADDLQYWSFLRALPFVTNLSDPQGSMVRPLAIPEYRDRAPLFSHDWHWKPFRRLDRVLIPTYLFDLCRGLDRQGLMPLKCVLGSREHSLGDASGILSHATSDELEICSSDLAAPISLPPDLEGVLHNVFLEYPPIQAMIPMLNQRYSLVFIDDAKAQINYHGFAELSDIRGVWVAKHGETYWCQLFGFSFVDNELTPYPGFIFSGATPGQLAVSGPRPGNDEIRYVCNATLAALRQVLAILGQAAVGKKVLLPSTDQLYRFHLHSKTHGAWTRNWGI